MSVASHPDLAAPVQVRNYSFLLGLIILIQGLVLLIPLNSTVLSRIDEAQIAEAAREMSISGDWVTPRIGGKAFAPYPPLPYWILAATGTLFGFNEFTMRLPAAAAAMLLVWVVARLARRMGGDRAGLASAMVLATLPCLFVQGSVCRADVLTTLLAAAGFDRFHAWAEHGRRPRDLVLMYLFAALGILAKGPIAVALLGTGGLSWFILRREWRLLLDMKLWYGIPAMLILVLPWYIAVHRANGPDFLRENLLFENVRAFTDGYQQKRSPFFYLRSLSIAAAPWIFLLAVAWHGRRARGLDLALAWSLGMLLLLSVSSAKRLNYIAYLMPPFAISFGLILAWLWSEHPRRLRIGIAALTGALLLAAGVCALLPPAFWKGGLMREAAPLFGVLSCCALPALLAVLAVNWWRGPVAGTIGLAALMAVGALVYSISLKPRLDGENFALATFYRRAASMQAGAPLYLTPEGGDGMVHYYSGGPLESRRFGRGLFMVTEEQKRSLDAEALQYRVLDSVEAQRGRGRFIVQIDTASE